MTSSTAHVLEDYVLRPQLSQGRRIRRGLSSFVRTKPLGAFGAVLVVLLILMALAPSAFTFGTNPNFAVISDRLQGPSGSHWFGTDQQGRDLYARIIYGARTSIIIGFGVVFVTSIIAATIGITSGYFGGLFDMLMQRVVDIGIALPGLIFIILVVTTLQNFPKTLNIILSVGVLVSLGSSRVIRGAAIAAKQNQYVEAARVVGATDARIIVHHILPNVMAVLLIGASIQIGGAILVEASLSFLGYGIEPPTASWGRMITEAQQYLTKSPHLAIFPGLAIFFTVYSFNMLGDALRDVLDPRLRGSR